MQVDRGTGTTRSSPATISKETWRQWRVPMAGDRSGEHEIRVRATDGAGETQSGVDTDPPPNGATGYHTIVVNVSS